MTKMDLNNQYWSNYTCQPMARFAVIEPRVDQRRKKKKNHCLIGSVFTVLLVAAGAFVFLSLSARKVDGPIDGLDIGPTNRSEDLHTTHPPTESPTKPPPPKPTATVSESTTTDQPTRRPTRQPTNKPTRPRPSTRPQPSTPTPTERPTEAPTDAPSSHVDEVTTIAPRPLTDELRSLLNEMDTNINSSINPCDDFYEFACGNFSKKHPLPENRQMISYLSMELEKMHKEIINMLDGDKLATSDEKPVRYVKKVWDSCVNEESDPERQMGQLMGYLEQLDKVKSPPAKFARITRDGFNAFFTVKVDPDPRDPSRLIISISPALHTLVAVHGLNESHEYFKHHLNLIRIATGKEANDAGDTQLLKDFAKFENDLSQNKSTSTIIESPFKLTSIVNVSELNEISQTEWISLLKDITGQKFDLSDEVLIIDRNYFKAFKKTVNSVNRPRIFWPAYFKTKVASDVCWLLPECRKSQVNLLKIDTNQTDDEIVKKYCFTLVVRTFDDLIITAYRDLIVDHDSDLVNLYNLLRKQLKSSIDKFSWMDDATKPHALDLIHLLNDENLQLSAPEWIRSNFEAKYLTYPFINSTAEEQITRFDLFQSIVRHQGISRFDLLNHPNPPKYSLSIPLLFPSPVLFQPANSVYLPSNLQRGFFFDPSYPMHAKMGLLGWQLAHELVHMIDEVGNEYIELFAPPERPNPFWTELTKELFDESKKCIEDIYSSVTEIKLNGTSSFTENFAELVGVNVAYKAYKQFNQINPEGPLESSPDQLKDLTDDQMFFMSYANAHCATTDDEMMKIIPPPATPPRYMVNVVLSQIGQFAKAFECPKGAKMNPVERCSLN